MDAYDVSNLEHEALLLVVASTAGNGDAPEGGAVGTRTLKVSRFTRTDCRSCRNLRRT